MNFIELLKATGQLPDKARAENGDCLEVEVRKNKLGYIATLWVGSIENPHHRIVGYGTGSTGEIAKDTLKNKILKSCVL